MLKLNKTCVVLFTALGLAVPTFSTGASLANEMTGREIMDEAGRRHDRPYEFETQEMVLIDKKGAEEVRDVRRYNRNPDDEDGMSLVVFDGPKGVEGVALLTHANSDGADDQWMLLPAQGKKPKRTAKGNKKAYFLGTDFTFEDMTSEDKDNYDYQRQPDEEVDGKAYFVIDAYPVDETTKKETGYQYRRLYFTQDLYLNDKTIFFDRRGKLLKTQYSSDFESIGEEAYRPRVTLMDNTKKKHQTRVTVLTREFDDKKVDKKKFQERFLTSGRYMRDK